MIQTQRITRLWSQCTNCTLNIRGVRQPNSYSTPPSPLGNPPKIRRRPVARKNAVGDQPDLDHFLRPLARDCAGIVGPQVAGFAVPAAQSVRPAAHDPVGFAVAPAALRNYGDRSGITVTGPTIPILTPAAIFRKCNAARLTRC